MLSLVYPCFLLLSVASLLCCLAFSFAWYLGVPSLILSSVSGCSLPSFVFSRFTLCQHFLKKIALPVHLLRQVFFEGPKSIFFRVFSISFLNIVFDTIFLRFRRGFGGVWEAETGLQIDFLSVFWGVFLEPQFLSVFLHFLGVFKKLETLILLLPCRRNVNFHEIAFFAVDSKTLQK